MQRLKKFSNVSLTAMKNEHITSQSLEELIPAKSWK